MKINHTKNKIHISFFIKEVTSKSNKVLEDEGLDEIDLNEIDNFFNKLKVDTKNLYLEMIKNKGIIE